VAVSAAFIAILPGGGRAMSTVGPLRCRSGHDRGSIESRSSLDLSIPPRFGAGLAAEVRIFLVKNVEIDASAAP
jgi:hypothetical protein